MTTLTREAAVDRMQEIHERIVELSGKFRLSRDDNREFDGLQKEFNGLRRQVEAADRAADEAELQLKRDTIASAVGGGNGLRLDAGSDDPYRDRGAGGAALRQLERSVKGGLPARSAEVVEGLLDTGTDLERSWVSRWVTDTGSPEYRSAFAKLLMYGEQRAGLEMNPAERAAFDRVTRLKGEQRAMSLTDSLGGFMVPFELDPTINITNAGSINPLLSIANVKTVTTDAWHGVSSAGVVSEFLAEAAEASDATPALSEPEIPCYKASTFIKFSVEIQGDAIGFMSEIGKLMNDGMLQLLSDKFTTGSGTGCPTGIVTALTGGSSVVNTATGGTLASDDVYNLQSSLGPRYQANARWVASLTVLNALRRAETSNGALQFPSLQTDPPTLLGRPAHELSNMDNTIAAGKNLAIYGDWSQFVITQRVGASLELIPWIMGPNQRPSGERGAWLWGRYGADSINDAAFRMLVA